MPRQIEKGSTDISLYFFIVDSADGSPETGVTITDLDLQYVRFGAAPSAKVDATALAATDSAHADNKAIEVDGTDQPGLYRVDWPDAAFATGVDGVILTVKGTGFHPAHMEIQLVDYDPTDSVRLGLTALPASGTAATPANVATELGTYDGPTKAEMDTAHALLATPANVATELGTYDGPTKAEMDTAHALLATPANVATELGTYDGPTKAEMDTAHALLATPANVATELSTYDGPTKAEMDTGHALLATAAKLLAYVRLLARSDAAVETDAATELTAINADEGSGGGDFSSQTDSEEAIRDRGDAEWVTGGGGSISDILNVQPLVPNAIDLANTATVRIGLGLTNMVDDLPTTAEITPGTITIDRKAIGGTSWTNVVNAAACSELAGLIYYDEVFDSGTGYAAGDTIRITLKSQKITVAANDYEITGTDGWIFHTYIREAMRGTDGANTTTPPTVAEIQAEMEEDGASVLDTLQDRLTAARAGYLDELAAANIPADIDAILLDTATTIPGTITTMQGNVTDILADSNELQGLISASKIAAQVKGMDAGTVTAAAIATDAIDADALAADAGTEIAAAVMASVVDGSLTVTTGLQILLGLAIAKSVTKADNVYTYKDQAGDTLITLTVGENTTTAVIA